MYRPRAESSSSTRRKKFGQVRDVDRRPVLLAATEHDQVAGIVEG